MRVRDPRYLFLKLQGLGFQGFLGSKFQVLECLGIRLLVGCGAIPSEP